VSSVRAYCVGVGVGVRVQLSSVSLQCLKAFPALSRCNPIGFKIGLEVMVRCRANPVKDVGITFRVIFLMTNDL
jgi:hypothetical protein